MCPDNHPRRVWRHLGQSADLAFTIARHTSPQQGVMVWDPSPMEHVRDMMGRRLHLPGNVDDLGRQLEQIWQEIPQQTIRVLYHSMPRHVATCIQARAESQKLLEKAPTSKDAGLTPPAERMSNITKYPGHLPDFACFDGNPRNQGLVGVDGACVNKTLCMAPQRKKSRQERSGERAGLFTGPPRPIHRPGYAVSNALRTSALKCAGFSSCWNHIRAFMLAGTLCSRNLHPYIQLAPYLVYYTLHANTVICIIGYFAGRNC
ncbi:transposable element Tc1 transposase [Trichonephila clavipes]|nr:transposable element Tc1 transposase [Trichonephila clavipes]